MLFMSPYWGANNHESCYNFTSFFLVNLLQNLWQLLNLFNKCHINIKGLIYVLEWLQSQCSHYCCSKLFKFWTPICRTHGWFINELFKFLDVNRYFLVFWVVQEGQEKHTVGSSSGTTPISKLAWSYNVLIPHLSNFIKLISLNWHKTKSHTLLMNRIRAVK